MPGVPSSLKLSTTTMSLAQLNDASARAMFGASLYVSMSGVTWSNIRLFSAALCVSLRSLRYKRLLTQRAAERRRERGGLQNLIIKSNQPVLYLDRAIYT